VAEDATVTRTRGCALRNALAHRTPAANPATLDDRLMLIIDGLYANGATLGSAGAALAAVAFAEDVLAVATGQSFRDQHGRQDHDQDAQLRGDRTAQS
jgi:hypothetical protein